MCVRKGTAMIGRQGIASTRPYSIILLAAVTLHVTADSPQRTSPAMRGMLRRLASSNTPTSTTTATTAKSTSAVTSTSAATTTVTTATTITSTTLAISTTVTTKGTSTAAPTTTSTTTTVAPVLAGSEGEGDSGDDTGILIGIIVGLVIFFLGSAAAFSAFVYIRKGKVLKHVEEIRQLEIKEDEYSAVIVQFTEKMEAQGGYMNRVLKKRRSGEPFPEEKHTLFLEKWQAFLVDHKKFIDVYTTALTTRREATGQVPGNAKRQRSRTSVDQMTFQKSLFPAYPATPLPEVQEQQKTMETLRTKMQAILQEYPDLNAELEVHEPPPLPTGSSASTPSRKGGSQDFSPGFSNERDPQLAEQVAMLKRMAHPLLAQAVVKPYGVLGSSDAQPDPKPQNPVEAVIVDPAGFPYIGQRNNPTGAGGASASIYRWLNISKGSGFPDRVHNHFKMECEADAETLAKYHCYMEGQHVIHAVGPKIRDLLDGLSDLTRTYTSVLTEFCTGLAAAKSPPKILRLLPISSGIFLLNKRLERYMAQMTWSALSLAFCSLPPSSQEQLKSCSIEVCIFQKKEVPTYDFILKEKMEIVSMGKPKLVQLPTDHIGPGSLPAKMGGFDWVRLKNGPADRLDRLVGFLLTEQAIWNRGFTLPNGKVVELSDTSGLLKGTRIRRATDRFMARSMTGLKLDVRGDDAATVMEVAVRCQQDGKKTVAVSAASAYNPGGASLTGGRHALEETWCTMSTLLKSLLHAKQTVQADPTTGSSSSQSSPSKQHGKLSPYIPIDGCIVSPSVQIFRDTSAMGYSFQQLPTMLLGVVSVAMFNMNPRMNDSPVDAPHDFTAYCAQVKQKFVAMTQAAAELGAEVLVCPDIGCGVFENDPTIVGTMLGEALSALPGHFLEVWIVGKVAFFEAARRAASGEKVHLERPPYFFTSGGPYEIAGVTPERSVSEFNPKSFPSVSSMMVNVGNPATSAGSESKTATTEPKKYGVNSRV